MPVLLAEPLSVAESLRFLAVTRQKVQVGPLQSISGGGLFPVSSARSLRFSSSRRCMRTPQSSRSMSCGSCRSCQSKCVEDRHCHPYYLPLRRLTLEPIEMAAPATVISCSVSPRLKLPEPRERLLLFAGKGGVGKTTMACATALRLAEEERPIVLLLDRPRTRLQTACACSGEVSAFP